jgi:hypothetical protein
MNCRFKLITTFAIGVAYASCMEVYNSTMCSGLLGTNKLCDFFMTGLDDMNLISVKITT